MPTAPTLSVKKAIEVGKILEANKSAFYEEPVPFDYLDETKRVPDALDTPIAWGKQESSQWRFKWMVESIEAVNCPHCGHPDAGVFFYFGPGQGGGVQANVQRWLEEERKND